ncbi:MAG: cytochrome ubiquinol oxidase subunit I, partial [Nitrospiraceae bacterium]
MTDLLAARSQMAMSLAFHIIFAAVGVAMPLMMVMAEWRWLRTGQEVYLNLAKRWAKGTAILFAVGAVSGTVLSFELGLLWPSFMAWSGSIIGLLFSMEGFAFFTEAIFL